MRSAKCRSPRRPNCCACWKTASCAAWAARSKAPSTCASSRPPTRIPKHAVAAGQLRGDLYYRLNVFNIHMPPLREHKEDIPAITEAMLHDMNAKHERHVKWRRLTKCSRACLAHDWPGNVRELRNTIERAVILCGEGYLSARDLPPGFGVRTLLRHSRTPRANAVQVEIGTTVDEAERCLSSRRWSRRRTTRRALRRFWGSA